MSGNRGLKLLLQLRSYIKLYRSQRQLYIVISLTTIIQKGILTLGQIYTRLLKTLAYQGVVQSILIVTMIGKKRVGIALVDWNLQSRVSGQGTTTQKGEDECSGSKVGGIVSQKIFFPSLVYIRIWQLLNLRG